MASENQAVKERKWGGARPNAGRKRGGHNQPGEVQQYIENLNHRPMRPQTAANILSCIDEVAFWKHKLFHPDAWLALKAGMYLTDRRDGKAVQKIDLRSLEVRVTPQDVARARETAEEMLRSLRDAGIAWPQRAEMLLNAPAEANQTGTPAEPSQAQTITQEPAMPQSGLEPRLNGIPERD